MTRCCVCGLSIDGSFVGMAEATVVDGVEEWRQTAHPSCWRFRDHAPAAEGELDVVGQAASGKVTVKAAAGVIGVSRTALSRRLQGCPER